MTDLTVALPSFPDFEGTVRDFSAWHLQAEFLRAAAFELWATAKKAMDDLCSAGKGSRDLRMGQTPPDSAFLATALSSAFLLYGFAMENLIKACIVKKYPSLPRIDAGKMRWDVGDHDLVGLARKAGINLTPGDRLILDTLAKWAVWQGRYPVPMKAPSHTRQRMFHDRAGIEACYLRLSGVLNES